MRVYELINLVLQAVKDLGTSQENQALIDADENTKLFGENLDSMGIVFLVSELESLISDELDIDITLADERAMSQKTSPFRSVQTLANYTQILIDEVDK